MSRENAQAALAQSVERRLGKAEVGGSIPLGTSKKRLWSYSRGIYYIKLILNLGST